MGKVVNKVYWLLERKVEVELKMWSNFPLGGYINIRYREAGEKKWKRAGRYLLEYKEKEINLDNLGEIEMEIGHIIEDDMIERGR